MERQLADVRDHVILCGWGRVGKAIAASLQAGATPTRFVVVDRDEERLAGFDGLGVQGDATEDDVLRRAGIDRARALVAALSADADNVYVTLAARRLHPDLFIVARARVETAEVLLQQAGANRVVNPQAIGGARMAALVCEPHIADFLDVAMHDAGLEFRLAELTIAGGSAVAGRSIRDAHLRDSTGALVLAIRAPDGEFRMNPDPGAVLSPGEVVIAIGTETQLKALREAVGHHR
jgi:voltage-gated potassium channel